MNIVINIILFQSAWFATVISVANSLESLAITSVLAVLGLHLYLVKDKSREVLLILIVGLIGFFVDSSLIIGNVFSASGTLGVENFAPVWLIMLWMLFAITINHSLAWLKENYTLAGVLGATFAPVAYYVGSNFEVLTFSKDYTLAGVMIVIGVTWAVVTPLMVFVSSLIPANEIELTDPR